MRSMALAAALLAATMTACAPNGSAQPEKPAAGNDAATVGRVYGRQEPRAALPAPVAGQKIATFAGGCFWCMQPPFDTVNGVIATAVGYSGGEEQNPTYDEVSAGRTGHTESIRIVYDPAVVSYDHLLDIFWRNIDPTQVGGQFADIGRQYRTAIFYHDQEQRDAAIRSRDALAASGRFDAPIAVEITAASPFYPAEEYHDKYYRKHYDEYKRYRVGSGREGYLQRVWGDGEK